MDIICVFVGLSKQPMACVLGGTICLTDHWQVWGVKTSLTAGIIFAVLFSGLQGTSLNKLKLLAHNSAILHE